MKNLFLLTFLLSVSFFACKDKEEEKKEDPKPKVDCATVEFKKDIEPIINTRCSMNGCHNAGSVNGDFNSYDGIKEKIDKGSFKERVLVKKDMPPGIELPDEEFQKIECWVNRGAENN